MCSQWAFILDELFLPPRETFFYRGYKTNVFMVQVRTPRRLEAHLLLHVPFLTFNRRVCKRRYLDGFEFKIFTEKFACAVKIQGKMSKHVRSLAELILTIWISFSYEMSVRIRGWTGRHLKKITKNINSKCDIFQTRLSINS